MFECLVTFFTSIIATAGYAGIFFLMTLESMVAPVPSEAVMPFAGFLVSSGDLSFFVVLFASTTGSIIGSLLSYYIGAYGGRPFLTRWGKYLLLNEHHLDKTAVFFKKYGEWTIFISRFIPIVRHLISIPAGMGNMNVLKFSFYTLAGAGMWNVFLLYTGILLKDNWTQLEHYTKFLDYIMLAVILGGVIYWFSKRKSPR